MLTISKGWSLISDGHWSGKEIYWIEQEGLQMRWEWLSFGSCDMAKSCDIALRALILFTVAVLAEYIPPALPTSPLLLGAIVDRLYWQYILLTSLSDKVLHKYNSYQVPLGQAYYICSGKSLGATYSYFRAVLHFYNITNFCNVDLENVRITKKVQIG